MPLHYGSITAEHAAVRETAGLFDVSHMGRLDLRGPDVVTSLERLVTRKLSGKALGRVIYTLVTNENGGVLDDILVYLFAPDRISLVVNASNREKLLGWFGDHLPETVEMTDRTLETAMVAIQGPKAIEIAGPILRQDIKKLGFYRFDPESKSGLFVSRTGYTGEDGVEISGPAEQILDFCRAATSQGAQMTGLGARDILRLEMGYPLYGHELNEQTNVMACGMGWAADLDGHDFVGAKAMRDVAAQGEKNTSMGLIVEGRGIPRQDCPVQADGKEIGIVTSGGFSPGLKKGIALARVEASADKYDAPKIMVRGKALDCKWQQPPFVEDRTARKAVRTN